jgi:pimeloyl-ACP methyl ester carboxylesterase
MGSPGGEVVLLLHGWPAGPLTWRRLAPLLASRFRVLIPELRDPDLRAQAEAVARLMEEMGVARVAAVGHGHGGAVAQLLALDHAVVDALVLIDSVALDQMPPVDLDPRTFIERGSTEFVDLAPEDLEAYLAFGAAVPEPLDLSSRSAEMSSWAFPVFLLWGEEDPFLPMAVAERLGETMPGSTLGVVPESGHFLLDDAFDPVGVMIHEYLRARYSGAPHGHEGVVMLQLERRPGWVEQEVGPHA